MFQSYASNLSLSGPQNLVPDIQPSPLVHFRIAMTKLLWKTNENTPALSVPSFPFISHRQEAYARLWICEYADEGYGITGRKTFHMQGFELVSLSPGWYPLSHRKWVRRPQFAEVVVKLGGEGGGLRGRSFVALAAVVEQQSRGEDRKLRERINKQDTRYSM